MPSAIDTPSPARTPDLEVKYRDQCTFTDDEYIPIGMYSHSENPLSQQLEPIAVVGMGCRLPGDVSSSSELWEMMMNKGTGQTPKVPESRFNIDAHFHADNERPGSFNVLGGYFLKDSLAAFDPSFFKITPIEAMWMDPQQRKLLEVVYEAFESGGIKLSDVAGSRTACFVGSFTSDYQQMSIKEPSFRHSCAATGVDPGIISNRISHVFDLKGPSIVVNTACSSSVYALHNACNAIRNDECSAAVVGGTNLIITVDQHMNTAKLGVLSPTSTCRTFDADANGYGRAEAIGALYIKKLRDALRDGDPIRGVIRSSAVNSNGRAPGVGITNPNRDGQARVISEAYRRGGNLNPLLTGYFETHGTGTALGDPIEVEALSRAMNKTRSQNSDPLLIGAVKTNIGHSEAASGISAVIKAILAVEKGIIPPTRGVVTLNPKIDWNGWKVRVPQHAEPFPSHLPVRRVSVNSFGYGGTNAHVIVEAADSICPSRPSYITASTARETANGHKENDREADGRPYLLPFSAHDKSTLKRNIAAHADIGSAYNLLDLSYTLANRRSRFPVRGFTVASKDSYAEKFSVHSNDFKIADNKSCTKLGFVFTGQGAQWAGMGNSLMLYYPSFLHTIRMLDKTLQELPDGPSWTIENVLREPSNYSIGDAELAQPTCTAIQVALLSLLGQWNIQPAVTVGHSSGEIAAACAAGLITPYEAIVIAYYRGQAVAKSKADASMMAVGLGVQAIQEHLIGLDGQVVVACHNSPKSVTLSGDTDALQSLKTKFDAEKIFARFVKTGGNAYHSHYMKPVGAIYSELLRGASKTGYPYANSTEGVSMVSTVTGKIYTQPGDINEDYWISNLLQPVLFEEAIRTVISSQDVPQIDVLIEVGPHSALAGPVRQILQEAKFDSLHYLPSLVRGDDSATNVLQLAGELFLRDYPLNMDRFASVETVNATGKISLTSGSLLVDLPRYQWDTSKEYWAEGRNSKESRCPVFPRHDLLGSLVSGASLAEPQWRNVLRLRDLPWLRDHSLGGEAVFPAAGYFSMAIEAITQQNTKAAEPAEIQNYVLRDIEIENPLVTPDSDSGVEVITTMRPSKFSGNLSQNWCDFSVTSIQEDGTSTRHITGSISVNGTEQKPKSLPTFSQQSSGKSWNEKLREVGFDYGPIFQGIESVQSDGVSYAATSKIKVFSGLPNESRYALHPGAIDSVLQLLIISIYSGRLNHMSYGAVPTHFDQVTIASNAMKDNAASAYAWLEDRGTRIFSGGSQLVGDDGKLLMNISNLRFTSYEAAVPLTSDQSLEHEPYGEVVWKPDFFRLNPDQSSGQSISNLLDLAIHRQAATKTLFLDAGQAKDALQIHDSLNCTVIQSNENTYVAFSQKNVESISMQTFLDSSVNLSSTFDLVIGRASEICLRDISPVLRPDGRVLVELDQLTSTSLFENTDFNKNIWFNDDKSVAMLKKTTAIEHEHPPTEVTLVYRQKIASFGEVLQEYLQNIGCQVKTASLNDHCIEARSSVILVADLEGPLLSTIQESEFQALQSIIETASRVIWITPGGIASGKRPEYAMTAGFSRSIRSEQSTLALTNLDIDLENTTAEQAASLTANLFGEVSSEEHEYSINKGQIHVSRLVPHHAANLHFSRHSEPTDPSTLPEGLELVAKVDSGRVGFQLEADADTTLGEHDVEVRVSVSGFCEEDKLGIAGLDASTTTCHEIGGVVTAIGSCVTELSVGQDVFGFSFNRLSTKQRLPAKFLLPANHGESLHQLVTLPMTYGPAVYGLKTLARVETGEVVLILPGTGLVGAAAIEVARDQGAIPFVVCANEVEAQSTVTKFDLPEGQVLYPADDTITTKIRKTTGGREADVIFASETTDSHLGRECWRNIAPLGRYVELQRTRFSDRTTIDIVPFQRGAGYLTFDMQRLYHQKPKSIQDILMAITELYRKRAIRALTPISMRPIADINDVLSSFTDDSRCGSPILVYDSFAKPVAALSQQKTIEFRSDATYLLVGCLGGLGRSLTSWMVKNGARRFAFLSRSGTDAATAAKLVRSLESERIAVQVIRGDISSLEDVERAVSAIPTEYPIRGVVNAAMVLKDGLFTNMSYENWLACTQPKVQGTLNLHKALENQKLDFFIMTSSTSGILGTPGQANYAASNAFLDNFARFRSSNSYPASSLVLPMVLGVGYVAEHPEIEEALKRKGIYGIDEEHLLEAFEASVAVQLEGIDTDHVISGMDPAELQVSLSSKQATDRFWIEDTRFATLSHKMSTGSPTQAGNSRESIIDKLTSAANRDDAVGIAVSYIIEKLSRLLLLPENDFESDRTIAGYGVDSMIGAELRNWIFREFTMDIPFNQLLSPALTIAKFAGRVCDDARGGN